jgi:hypothetical protein
MSDEAFIPISRSDRRNDSDMLGFEERSKLMYMVAHAVQAISVFVAPDGGMKIAAEYHTEMSR